LQAYSKQALPVLHWLTRLAAQQGDRLPVRLVKAAYWDSKLKQSAATAAGGCPGIGTALTSDPRIAGVVFTGSTDTARQINLNLAGRKQAPLAVLIAETGGLNAMIADSTSLRVLYLQEEIAAKVETLLTGAMAELKVGDPGEYSTDVGPVIDADAQAQLNRHIDRFVKAGKLLAQTPLAPEQTADGHFVAPVAFAIDSMAELDHEPFGPIQHIVRYRAKAQGAVFDEINAAGYGLTPGMHSRNQQFAERVKQRVRAGNIYVNRNMIGAVVDVQPFGGLGLSGTAPKAGGPHYLLRFAAERSRAVNTAALGGNTTRLSLAENAEKNSS